MKRTLAVIAAASMLGCFTACEDYNTYENTGSASSETVTTAAAATTAAATTAATTAKEKKTTAATASTTAEASSTEKKEDSTKDTTTEATKEAEKKAEEGSITELKDKLQSASMLFRKKERNSTDTRTFEAYARSKDVSDKQLDSIQTLICDKETGEILYLSVCDKNIPYSDAVSSDDDAYYKKSAEDIDDIIDVKAYLKDVSGSYEVYFGADGKTGSYTVTTDMKGSDLVKMMKDSSDYMDKLSKIMGDLDNSFIYKMNKYEPWMYIPSSLGKSKKNQ